jgi:hypothetical protein
LKWNLEVGPHFKALEKVEEQTGRTPGMLLDQPQLHETVYWVWEAFAILDKGRQWGHNGPQPILISEMRAYIQLNEIKDTHDLVRYIQGMDGVYLKHHRDQMEKKSRGRT